MRRFSTRRMFTLCRSMAARSVRPVIHIFPTRSKLQQFSQICIWMRQRLRLLSCMTRLKTPQLPVRKSISCLARRLVSSLKVWPNSRSSIWFPRRQCRRKTCASCCWLFPKTCACFWWSLQIDCTICVLLAWCAKTSVCALLKKPWISMRHSLAAWVCRTRVKSSKNLHSAISTRMHGVR